MYSAEATKSQYRGRCLYVCSMHTQNDCTKRCNNKYAHTKCLHQERCNNKYAQTKWLHQKRCNNKYAQTKLLHQKRCDNTSTSEVFGCVCVCLCMYISVSFCGFVILIKCRFDSTVGRFVYALSGSPTQDVTFWSHDMFGRDTTGSGSGDVSRSLTLLKDRGSVLHPELWK